MLKNIVESESITHKTGMGSGSRDRNRELIRIRDNHTCQICGKKWKEGMRRFDVHHIDCDNSKTRKADNLEKEKDNLETLCHKCHLNLPEHREKMKKNKIK
jgi:5-methylcytosine-specific restriction endonuclease McrA